MTAREMAGTQGSRYREAGVDIDKASRTLGPIGALARSTLPSDWIAGDFGHFGGVYPLPAGDDRLLVASADGIGTKIKIAFVLGEVAHRRVGADLVNHCVNDILACGARPLFFLDYVAMGSLAPDTLEALVGGMADACRGNNMVLIGGETAEMPGLYQGGEYDAAGFIVGEVQPDRFIDGREVAAGDVLYGFPALGLHTNGYSLARMIVELTGDREYDLAILAAPLSETSDESLGTALMAPHPSYVAEVRPLLEAGLVRGMAHITGGGLVDNVPRMLPEGLAARIDPSTWQPNPIFQMLVERGDVSREERYRVFNMGIGFVVAIRSGDEGSLERSAGHARRIGEVVALDETSGARVQIVEDEV
jgi:phosphoribosylformylglycinamidine cyclo-ligase